MCDTEVDLDQRSVQSMAARALLRPMVHRVEVASPSSFNLHTPIRYSVSNPLSQYGVFPITILTCRSQQRLLQFHIYAVQGAISGVEPDLPEDYIEDSEYKTAGEDTVGSLTTIPPTSFPPVAPIFYSSELLLMKYRAEDDPDLAESSRNGLQLQKKMVGTREAVGIGLLMSDPSSSRVRVYFERNLIVAFYPSCGLQQETEFPYGKADGAHTWHKGDDNGEYFADLRVRHDCIVLDHFSFFCLFIFGKMHL